MYRIWAGTEGQPLKRGVICSSLEDAVQRAYSLADRFVVRIELGRGQWHVFPETQSTLIGPDFVREQEPAEPEPVAPAIELLPSPRPENPESDDDGDGHDLGTPVESEVDDDSIEVEEPTPPPFAAPPAQEPAPTLAAQLVADQRLEPQVPDFELPLPPSAASDPPRVRQATVDPFLEPTWTQTVPDGPQAPTPPPPETTIEADFHSLESTAAPVAGVWPPPAAPLSLDPDSEIWQEPAADVPPILEPAPPRPATEEPIAWHPTPQTEPGRRRRKSTTGAPVAYERRRASSPPPIANRRPHVTSQMSGGDERRNSPRLGPPLPAELTANVRLRDGTPVVLIDISWTGARLQFHASEPPHADDLIVVAVHAFGLVSQLAGRVKWVRRGECGIEFDSALMTKSADDLLGLLLG